MKKPEESGVELEHALTFPPKTGFNSANAKLCYNQSVFPLKARI